ETTRTDDPPVTRSQTWETTVPPEIPGYELLKPLGRGGMGLVWKARQISSDRIVALKVMNPEFRGDIELALRFQLEARAAARIDHPGVIRVFDVGEHAGCSWFSMEYCPAETTLQSRLGAPLPPSEAAGLVEQVARGVAAAHQRQIVHRDLKPANILLTASGETKVADFGLASVADLSLGLTRTGSLLGTPPYMSPEQIRGTAREITPRSDVYALGAILFQALTGKAPFEGTRSEIMRATCETEPVWPRNVRVVPTGLETICLRCLQKEPARRLYATAGELADDLRRWRERFPIRARPVGWRERGWLWVRRNRAASIALVLLLLLLPTAAMAVRNGMLLRELAVAREQLLVENTVSRLTEGALHLSGGPHVQMREKLDGCPPEHRNWEWRHLAQQCRFLGFLRGHTLPVSSVAVSRDGRWIASGSHDGTLCLWRPGEERPARKIECGQGYVRCLSFHPDGVRIATGGDDGSVWLWEIGTGQGERLPVGNTDGVQEIRFSRDGRLLAAGGLDTIVRVWNLESGVPVFTSRPHPGGILTLDIHPDGKSLAAAGAFPEIWIWNLATGQKTQTLSGHENSRIGGVAFSPDGALLASGGYDCVIKIWNLKPGQLPRELLGHTADVNCVCWKDDGTQIASVGDDSTVRVWDSSTGQERLSLRGHAGHTTSVAFIPGASRVVSGSDDHAVGIWNTAGDTLALVANDDTRGTRASFHPSGSSVAICDGTAEIRIVELASRRGHVWTID
ncbi:MAG: hypothetical protein EHM42_07445, partial [Planctomycetaceae bacterium]